MKRFLGFVRSSMKVDPSVHKWREHLLCSDEWHHTMSNDPKIKSLQVIYTSFSPSHTFTIAFATFATLFSTAPEEDAINYLRGCLLVLVEYSLCTSNFDWISRKETLNLEKTIKRFELEFSRIVNRSNDPRYISMENCVCHAHTIEREANLGLLRVTMIKTLNLLASTIQPSFMYKYHDPRNPLHRFNATEMVRQMTPHSHAFIGTAFALINNHRVESSGEPFALCALPEDDEKDESLP